MYTAGVDANGRRVKELRLEGVYTWRELAEKSEVSKDTFSRVERGAGAYPSTIHKLAAASGVHPRELVKGVAMPSKNRREGSPKAGGAERVARYLREISH
jgi:transcriptional regulator with XRE-family HTH domain